MLTSHHCRCLKQAYDCCLTARELSTSAYPGSHLRSALDGGVLQFEAAHALSRVMVGNGCVDMFARAPLDQTRFPRKLAIRMGTAGSSWLSRAAPISVVDPDGKPATLNETYHQIIGNADFGVGECNHLVTS